MNDNVIKEFIDSIRGEEINKDVIYSATISHVDNEGVVWVFLPGANKATPTESSSADVRSGDVVNVQWQNNKLYILGNYSNPSAGMTQMRQAEQSANRAREAATKAQATAEGVADIANSADSRATTAINLAEGVNEHFWYDSTGAHITEDKQEDYQDDPANAGGNTLITSQGMAIRKGQTPLATFAVSGAQIGITNSGHTIITAQGLKVYGGNGYQLANLGYGEGKNAQGQTVVAPYFSLGDRATNSVVGNFSVAEGTGNIASGFCAHAEGYSTTASEGASHAEGYSTTASGGRSHAEGLRTIASGHYSHAQNRNTIAGHEAQTAIGQYNDNKQNNAFEIGNGISNTVRSNAFEVDWDGNVLASGDIEDGQGNVLANKADKVEEGTIDGWSYRKESNGKVEAWYDYNPSASATYTTWVSPIKYRDITLPIPPEIFSDEPRVFAISRNNQIWVVSAVPSSATSVTIRLATLSSSAVLSRFRIYATNY